MPKPKKQKEWFEWTVRFRVHRAWVEDGFDLDDERAKEMIENELKYSHGSETKAHVISRPNAHTVARAMGYDNAKDRKRRLG